MRLKKIIILEVVIALILFMFGSFSIIQAQKNKKDVVAENHSQKKEERRVFEITSIQKKSSISYLKEIKEELINKSSDFLEINLSKKNISVYRKGRVVGTVPVLAHGDPQGWGSTPTGFYKAEYKSAVAYSGISKVYMPSAISFYGKYLIHGEPYYPSGIKLRGSFSGGCIRLKDKDAEFVYNNTKTNTPIIITANNNDNYAHKKPEIEPPNIKAKSFLIADIGSSEIIAQKNSNVRRSIASITKLMTATVVSEHLDLRKHITAKSYMLEEGYGSTKGILPGRTYGLVELFHPLLVSSSNDAAEILAGFLGRNKTISVMNEKAKSLNMQNTNFADPSGFHQENKSSVIDLFKLTRYIFYNIPPIFKITLNEKVDTFGLNRFSDLRFSNLNEFVNDYNFLGGKTGYTVPANYTGTFLFKFKTIDGVDRIINIIILGSNDLRNDVLELKNWLEDEIKLIPEMM